MLKMKEFSPNNNKKTKTAEPATNDLVSNATLTTEFLSNDDYTLQPSFNHDEFLKQVEEKNNKLHNEIETSYNNEIKEQLRLNNTALMNTIDPRFSAFQTVMLQTIKDLVQSLVIFTN